MRLNHLEWKEEMTDPLKALRDQAWQYASTQTPSGFVGGAWHKYRDAFEEKFAELIIKECAEQIISKGTDWVDFAPSQTGVRPEYWDMAQQIKEHFGVE